MKICVSISVDGGRAIQMGGTSHFLANHFAPPSTLIHHPPRPYLSANNSAYNNLNLLASSSSTSPSTSSSSSSTSSALYSAKLLAFQQSPASFNHSNRPSPGEPCPSLQDDPSASFFSFDSLTTNSLPPTSGPLHPNELHLAGKHFNSSSSSLSFLSPYPLLSFL